MSGFTIPASLVNMRVHAVTDLALGVICFIFQIASLATSPSTVLEQIGIGFWGGIILAITAVAAYKASTGDAPFMLGCSFVLAIMSFFISFSIMCIFAASIDQMNKHPNPCLSVVYPNGTFNGTQPVPIPPCGDHSPSREAFDAILLICGLVGIPVNLLLTMGTVTTYSPASGAPAA